MMQDKLDCIFVKPLWVLSYRKEGFVASLFYHSRSFFLYVHVYGLKGLWMSSSMGLQPLRFQCFCKTFFISYDFR